MKVVEFLGVPGAGKSTLATLLAESLSGALTLEEAARAGLAARGGNDHLTRWAARAARSSRSRIWNLAYARSTDRFAALERFVATHPQVMGVIAEIQERRAGRDLHPEMVQGWILNLMARYQLATEADLTGCLVVDEGFAQRGVALLAGGFVDDDIEWVPRYLAVIPRPDALVVVETPLEEAACRLDSRGWSARLEASSPDERSSFLQSASRLVAATSAQLRRDGVEVIWVSGTTPPPDAVDSVTASLAV